MQFCDGQLLLSASDLASHLACPHLTQLNREVALGRRQRPASTDPRLETIRRLGSEHETAYVGALERAGRTVHRFPDDGDYDNDAVMAAMRSGVDVIVQTGMQEGRYRGRADLLLRVEQPSRLGAWSYEVADTKLAQETRAGTILQLCLYSNLLEQLQGAAPEFMSVIKPGSDRPFEEERLRVADYMAYYRVVKHRLEEAVGEDHVPGTYPEPVLHCDVCDWWRHCRNQRRSDDHLGLVAGIRASHIQELNRQGTMTLAEFARQPEPLRERPERGSRSAYERVHDQAKIQLRGREQQERCYELLPAEPGRGLALLPEASAEDVFLDFEGDPFVPGGGIEYLLGYAIYDRGGALQYVAQWALKPAEERASFEQFIDFIMDRISRFPDLHVYHFAPYEPAALKRLMGRYGTREEEMDRLLRSGRFVDLYAVSRQGLRASVERYSLKDLEQFAGYQRDLELPLASTARLRVECALEVGRGPEISAEDRTLVERYNRDDCLATVALRDWLERRREALVARGTVVVRPQLADGDPSDQLMERAADVRSVYERLTAGLPEDRDAWTDAHRGLWLLAHLLEYFRREDRCAWWEFFRLLDLEEEDLLDERKAVTGLTFERADGGTERCPIHVYRFPAQEVSIDVGATLYATADKPVGTVVELNAAQNTVKIKKRADAAQMHPKTVVVNERVTPRPLDESLLELARWVADNGIDAPGPFRVARDLLMRRPPRLSDASRGEPLRRPNESALEAARRLVHQLEDSILPLQGPPGAGKTFAGAELIVELVQAGKRLGITAVSHKVIRNLIDAAVQAGERRGVRVMAAHKGGQGADDRQHDSVAIVTNNDAALTALDEGRVVGGTAWLWTREDAIETLDYLFVDEAGQMSLAHVLAAARSARNLVLLGDPQQLEQPQRGAHPEGAEIAALQHILGGRPTMPDEHGLFLEETWRLHPAICAFTSELFYESRLQARPETAAQQIAGETPFSGAGLFHVPAQHRGNQNHAPEEVDKVAELFVDLTQSELCWIDRNRQSRPITSEDVLIVAPFNAQVSAIKQRLPAARVGTIDKFQGQEAPIVIYSMASSSAEDAPRGLSFLYDLHRLNVATSRAKCVCILVANDAVFSPECRSPEQMRLANALCRYRELAQRSD